MRPGLHAGVSQRAGPGPTPQRLAKPSQLWLLLMMGVGSSGLLPGLLLPQQEKVMITWFPSGVLSPQPHPQALRGAWWGRGQNKPTAHHPSLQPSVLTPLQNPHKRVGATRAGATRKSHQASGARGKRNTHKPSTWCGGRQGTGPPLLTLSLFCRSVSSGLSGGSVRMIVTFSSGSLAECTELSLP